VTKRRHSRAVHQIARSERESASDTFRIDALQKSCKILVIETGPYVEGESGKIEMNPQGGAVFVHMPPHFLTGVRRLDAVD
jgi:hypothetical protein